MKSAGITDLNDDTKNVTRARTAHDKNDMNQECKTVEMARMQFWNSCPEKLLFGFLPQNYLMFFTLMPCDYMCSYVGQKFKIKILVSCSKIPYTSSPMNTAFRFFL